MHRLIALLLLFMPASAVLADWPLFRGDAAQTGVTRIALAEPLAIRWQVKLPRGIGSTAAIVDGVAYVGCYDQHLYAFDLATGQQKWKFQGGSFKAAPSVHKGTVYVGDEDGTFYCIDAAKGTKRWDIDVGFQITGGANFFGDLVLFCSHDSTLHAVLAADGKPAWTYKTQQGPIFGSVVVAEGMTFLAGCDSMLHIVDVKTGKGIAQVELSGQSGSTPAFVGGKLYVPNMTNEVQAIDLAKRKVAWSFVADEGFDCSAAATDQRVVVGCDDGNVYALDAINGKPAWTFATKKGRVNSSPVIAGKRVYVGTTAGSLFVLDLDKGTELQKLQLGRSITASPAVAEDCLVIGTADGVLYCLGKKK
jgi:outer membrane protein assembly factor BamB